MNNINQTVLVNLKGESFTNQKNCSENLCDFCMNLIVHINPLTLGVHLKILHTETNFPKKDRRLSKSKGMFC